jgi:hypothetical protein
MKTWEQLLRTLTSVKNEPTKFGPHSKAIGSAIIALQDASWYANVGTPSPFDDRVVRVRSWDEALTILDDPPGYFRGVLDRPSELVSNARKAKPTYQEWWRAARDLFRRAVDVEDPPSEGWSLERQAEASDHLTVTFECLLDEIIVADDVQCTYLREQLQWFAAGHFPCGWEGDWPIGKMRVF